MIDAVVLSSRTPEGKTLDYRFQWESNMEKFNREDIAQAATEYCVSKQTIRNWNESADILLSNCGKVVRQLNPRLYEERRGRKKNEVPAA